MHLQKVLRMSAIRTLNVCLGRRVSDSCENTAARTRQNNSPDLTLLLEMLNKRPPLMKGSRSQWIPARRNKIPKAISRRRSLGREEHGIIPTTKNALLFKRNLTDASAKNTTYGRDSYSECMFESPSLWLSCENTAARTRQNTSSDLTLLREMWTQSHRWLRSADLNW